MHRLLTLCTPLPIVHTSTPTHPREAYTLTMGVPIALMRTWGLPPMSTPGYHRWQLHNLPWPVDHFTKIWTQIPRSRSVDPALAREAAITKQLIETPKEERPLSRISRWDLYDYIQGVFLTVPPDFSYQHEKKSYTRRRYWCFGVRYTGNSREQDRPRDRSLSGPSVR